MKRLLVTIGVLSTLIASIALLYAPSSAASPAPTTTPALAITDWLPPNPYQDGMTPDDVAYPVCPNCNPPKTLNAQCAAACRATYASGRVDLEQYAHDLYETIADELGEQMDQFGVEAQQCLAACQGDPVCEDACWATNQQVSEAAYNEAVAQVAGLNSWYFDQLFALRAAYCECLAGCCRNTTQPPH